MDRTVADILPFTSSEYVHNQPMPSKHNFAFLCPLLTIGLTITLSTDQDLECGGVSMGASMRQVESVELASLTQPSTGLLNANENAGLDVDGNNTAITVGFPTSSTTPTNVGQKPGAGILDNHQPTKKDPFIFRSGISSRGLTRNQITSSDSAVDNHPTLASVSIPSNAVLPGDVVEESPKIDETSFRTPENVQ
jgi:hypothetical protein